MAGEIISQVYYDNDSDENARGVCISGMAENEIAKSDYIFDENDDFYVNIIGYYQKKKLKILTTLLIF